MAHHRSPGRRGEGAACAAVGRFRLAPRRALALDARRSSVRGSGPNGRLVTLRLVLTPGRSLAGQRLAPHLGASDDDGATQALRPAGTLVVRRR